MNTQYNPVEQAAINAVIKQLVEAWNRHNAHDFAALFLSQGEWTNVMAQVANGQTEIEKMHEYPFSTTLKEAFLTIKEQRLTWLRPDMVSVDLLWESTGNKTPTGESLGQRNGLLTMILSKEQDQGWLIALGHNLDYTATYKRADFVKER